MDSAKVIIINNNIGQLEEQGSEFFARFFIALILDAARRRSHLTDDQKIPVYFYIDECQTVISRDEKTAQIIDQCRSQKIALILAHQRIRQIVSENVLGALANCAIRFANCDDDAPQLAPRLHATPEFLRQQRGSFAAYVRDLTKEAVSLTVPLPPKMQAMTQGESEQIRNEMRARYCTSRAPERPDQFDLHWNITLNPRMARDGGDYELSEDLSVRIPPGTKNGSVLRLKGRGAPKPDDTMGDLYLHVTVPPRPPQRAIGSGDSGLNEWG
jgi:hypothetical protein